MLAQSLTKWRDIVKWKRQPLAIQAALDGAHLLYAERGEKAIQLERLHDYATVVTHILFMEQPQHELIGSQGFIEFRDEVVYEELKAAYQEDEDRKVLEARLMICAAPPSKSYATTWTRKPPSRVLTTIK